MVINKAHISSPNPLVSNLNNTRSRMMLPQRRRLSEATADQPGDTGRMTPGSVTPTTDIASVMENFKNKNSMVAGRQNKLNSLNSLNQRNQQLSSSSSQVLSNSSTSTTSSSSTLLAQSSSSRVHHMKAKAVKSGLNEMQNSMSEMRNLTDMRNITEKFRSSMENLVDGNDGDGSIDLHLDDIQQPLVTFPDPESPPPGELQLENLQAKAGSLDTVQFEAKSSTSASTRKVVTDGFSSEKNVQNSAQSQSLRAGDVSYRESSNANASRARLELDGVRAEKSVASLQENRSLKTGDMEQQESNKAAATTMKVRSSAFSAEQSASAQALQRQTMAGGVFNQEKHSSSSSHSNITMSSKTASILTATQLSELMNGGMKGDEDTLALGFEDLEKLSTDCNPQDVKDAIQKYSHCLDTFVKGLRKGQQAKAPGVLDKIHEILRRAWAVPTHGHELGYSLCNALRNSGGLELLMTNCITDDAAVKFSSAQLLEQCLTTENRAYVVENGLEKVVNVACLCTKTSNSAVHSRVGTGILEHLFKHSEVTCGDVIRLGGLDAVLFECRKNDIDTLRHCAGALANLSLYGGAENQEAMIKRKVPMWLFPLAFHNDDHIKYYACLAIAVLVANKEIEAAVLKSGTLDLVEPFVTSHNPSEFAKSNLAHAHGQSKFWLQRLVPVLSSKREEARNLAAFHFCMEAGIKQQQGNTEIFREIGAVEPLKKVASCPNAVASKYAAQALRLIGEEVPHKLSQQVPLWSIEDVREWVKQIGFAEYADYFVDSRVDGDLLLQLTEDNLQEDIGLTNGIRRKRFTRELQNLKKMADYSSRDQSNLNSFLQNIAPEFSIYTYSMLNAGVDRESLRNLGDDHLIAECGIHNSIHRLRILEQLKKKYDEDCAPGLAEENVDKNLDVFVSYRRSNGSQLASLLKVHLQLRGFSVFIDVERLEAGKFDNNLLQSIRHAKHFLLVLTPKALERCKADVECKDWVHREIVAALQSQCNIIPIIDNFTWPEAEELPDDMRAVCHFNGVRWIHDYQDACVDKLERFMRGEMNFRDGPNRFNMGSMMNKGDATPGTPASSVNMRHPPTYQRMHSSDSSKSGDKDMNGNGSAKD